ncbi:hypothetical protein E2I00_013048 [Balaenoptera physalus]|uniref:C2H2-type domain-containing protein n=1 Tax=Balaenoptera physalus TaxID=9770 RepID=A0A6A1QFR8_BALPH|nr:hypothetical protein E2I00_013048 [Balaenoptera physalus]
MAAPETQGAATQGEEDGDGNRGGTGGVSYEAFFDFKNVVNRSLYTSLHQVGPFDILGTSDFNFLRIKTEKLLDLFLHLHPKPLTAVNPYIALGSVGSEGQYSWIYIPKFLMSASCLLLPSTDSKDCILEPLSLPESPGGTTSLEGSPSVPCIFCEEHFLIDEQDKLLKHMIIEHKTVIADVKLVADFQRGERKATKEQDNYFLLCDVLPEDRILREELQKQRLGSEEVETIGNRALPFNGYCLLLSFLFMKRSVLLNHMAREHTFNIGLPDNIVNCNEFLCTLQKKLDNLQCLYCEKTFRDKNTLKDHMRKKQHRRINPKNREYDRFYVINYLGEADGNCSLIILYL